MSRPTYRGVPKLSDALEMARELGMSVTYYHRHGEWSVSAPGRPPLKVNARRKDASSILMVYIRQAERRKLA